MYLYCEKCRLAFDDNRCPVCGERKLRSPKPNDLCFLCEKQVLWGRMLEEILKRKGVPVFVVERFGTSMSLKTGSLRKMLKIYVPFFDLHKADRIQKIYFPESVD